jgi:hypothetical protein
MTEVKVQKVHDMQIPVTHRHCRIWPVFVTLCHAQMAAFYTL